MMKRHSIVRAVKVIICLLTPILLSFSGIGVNDIDKNKSTSKEVDDTLRIVITGDLLLDRGVRQKIDMAGVDALFSPTIDSLFHSSNYVIANLECPVTKNKGASVQNVSSLEGNPNGCLHYVVMA